MWSTTAAGKAILSEAWNEFTKQGVPPEIYLIFTYKEVTLEDN